MNDCERAAERLVDHLDGALEREERGWMDAHLASCAECGAAAASYRAIRAAYREVEPAQVRAELAASLVARAREEAHRSAKAAPGATRSPRFAGRVAIAAGVLALVGLAFFAQRGGGAADVAALLGAGDALRAAGDTGGAIAAYEDALRHAEGETEAPVRHRLASALAAAGMHEQALEQYALVAERYPHYPRRVDVLLGKGAAEQALGRLTEAIRTYGSCAAQYPESAQLVARRMHELPGEAGLSALGYLDEQLEGQLEALGYQ